MAPSAEGKDGGVCVEDAIVEDQKHVQHALSTPKRNVAFAVNYELSLVDQFTASERKRRGSSTAHVEGVPGSTSNPWSSMPLSPKNDPSEEPNVGKHHRVVIQSPLEETSNKRRSIREKKKDMVMAKTRVRYDMQLVPVVKRNRSFLHSHPLWWMIHQVEEGEGGENNNQGDPTTNSTTTKMSRRSSRLLTTTDTTQVEASSSTTHPLLPCTHSHQEVVSATSAPPFVDNETVLWIPTKRSEWEDSVSEMMAVCTSAALRRFLQSISSYSSSPTPKPFYPPLSRDYIRDRVDIDDPLNGFQLRHRTGGWLQGFVLWTTFTTWTHDFEWNSLHPGSGFDPTEPVSKVDSDGSLAEELQAQARSGNPHENGIVFESIAEIGLVGGLGCGEYLLRMTLDSIRLSPHNYRYVVLQATDQSKEFYERFGFVRVGAICRYPRTPLDVTEPASTNEEEPLEGYRHWTHANESEKSLQKHGGPSYMMCLKLLPVETDEAFLSRSSFLEHMLTLAVDHKPTIEQLGGSFTPGPKILQASSAGDSIPTFTGSISKNSGRRGSGSKRQSLSLSNSLKPSNVFAGSPSAEPSAKRRKLGPIPELAHSRERLSSPLPDGATAPCAQQRNRACLSSKPVSSDPRGKRTRLPRTRSVPSTVPSTPVPASAKKSKKSSAKCLKSTSAKKKFHSSCDKLDKDGNPRTFYSVRGPDGRFVTIQCPPPSSSSSQTMSIPRTSTVKPKKASPASASLKTSDRSVTRINKAELVKQKVKSYPRSRPHFYNRVVKLKSSKASKTAYYFVLNYDESDNTLCLVPLAAKSTLSGKHEGRPRYQAVLEETNANFLRNVVATNYEVVPATMIMKTPVVANEAWDVEDD